MTNSEILEAISNARAALTVAEGKLAAKEEVPTFWKAREILACEQARAAIRTAVAEKDVSINLSMGMSLTSQLAEIDRVKAAIAAAS